MSEPSVVLPPVALVTGCSSGIGHALALALHQAGYQVIATARQPHSIADLAAAGIQTAALDVDDPAQIAAVLQQITAQQQRLDLLVNNAGFGAIGPLFDQSSATLQQQFQTNVFALVELTRQALPLLRQSAGTVVNIGSVSASLVTPFAGAYCASKAAVHALTQAMQMELAPFNIRVLLAITGAINTGFAKRARQQAEQTLATSSWWAPYQAGLFKRANASQNRPTPVDRYAKALVQAIQTPGLTQVRLGSGSRLLPLLSLLPSRLLQWILRRSFLQPG